MRATQNVRLYHWEPEIGSQATLINFKSLFSIYQFLLFPLSGV